MHCKKVQDHLERYNEGSLGGVIQSAIERHLQGCSGCRRIYENSKMLRLLVKESPLPAMSRDAGTAILTVAANSLIKQPKDKNKSTLFQKWKKKTAISMRLAFGRILLTLLLPVKGEVLMKKSGYRFIVVLLGLTLAGVTAFFIRTNYFSDRVVLSDELKEHRRILHDADGHHACDCFSPLISYFEVSDITPTSATFTWDCSSPSTYQVNYGLTEAKGTLYPPETPTVAYTEHSVTVKGLEPNTTYHAGPSSICLSNCTRNREAGLVKQWLMTNKRNCDWTFTTETAVSVLDENKVQSGTATCAISDFKVKKITGQNVTIVWKTNVPATSLIEYGLTKEYGMQSGTNMEKVHDHDIQLFDLQKDTTYYCRGVSYTEGSVDPVYSQPITFVTPAVEERIVNKKNVYNEPNPCSDWTVFSYFCYQPVKRVTIDIMTLSGKVVASLESPSSALAEGWNKVRWDVRDNNGKALSNGVYVYVMKFQTSNNFEEEIKSSGLRITR